VDLGSSLSRGTGRRERGGADESRHDEMAAR
jgi:hypothetical protein